MRAVQRLAVVAISQIVLAGALASASVADAQTTLRDQRGMPFDLAMLRGTPTVLTFIATHCRDACPLINAQFEDVQRQLRSAHLPLRLLSLTLDPQNDHLADMQRVARTFEADPKYWVLATGTRPTIDRIMRRFGVVAQKDARGYADTHTTFIYVLDKRGRLVKTMLAGSRLSADLFTELEHDWRNLNS